MTKKEQLLAELNEVTIKQIEIRAKINLLDEIEKEKIISEQEPK